MLTLPKIVERAALPYVAIRRTVQIPFGDVVDTTLPKLFGWVGRHGVEPAGPPMFKYNVIDMARDMEIDFGVAHRNAARPRRDGGDRNGCRAGRYATLTFHGHYRDRLIEGDRRRLIEWARECGLQLGYGIDARR